MRTRRWAGVGTMAALAVSAPLVVGIAYLLTRASTDAAGAWTAQRTLRVLSDRAVWTGAAWSVATAGAATGLALAAAIGAAVLLRGQSALERTARAMVTVPLPIPHLVAGTLGVLVLAQSGLAVRVLLALGLLQSAANAPSLINDAAGVGAIVVLAWKEFPFLFLLASAVLAQRGTALEEAARTLGATPWMAFRLVTWPVLRRSLAPAAIAVFAFAAGCFEIAALLGPSTPLPFPVLMYERSTDAALALRADADVLALLAIAAALLVVALHEWARHRAESHS